MYRKYSLALANTITVLLIVLLLLVYFYSFEDISIRNSG